MKFVNLHGGWKAGTHVCGRARGDSRIKKQSKLILNPKFPYAYISDFSQLLMEPHLQ